LNLKTLRAASGLPMQVAGVNMPRRKFAHYAADIARASLPAVLVRHAQRVFILASLAARRLGIDVTTPDLLYVSAQFANMGLTAHYAESQQRYELDSADAALAFLRKERVRHAHSTAVWNAIALHTTPGVTERMAGLSRLLAYGVRADLYGEGFDLMTSTERREIHAAFPRGDDFSQKYLEAIARGIAHRPESTFGCVSADVLERFDANFIRLNFCGRVLGSRSNTA
jgi:hypothetical protein